MQGLRIRVLWTIVLVATSSLQVANASVQVAHCCCGSHDLADACGCPHCPSEHADGDRHAPSQSTITRCAVSESPAITSAPMFTHPTLAFTIHRPVTLEPTHRVTAPAPAPVFEPPLEPPR